MNKSVYRKGIFCAVLICFANCTGSIRKEVEKQNRQLPQRLTDVMRIDSTVFLEETNVLRYYYTVMNDSVVLNCNYDETQKGMATEIKKASSMKVFRNQEIDFEYIYMSDKSKDILLKIIVPADMYK